MKNTRRLPVVPIASVLILSAAGVAASPSAARAQQPSQNQNADAAASSALPVRSVTLFSSGVSYILREGEVTGDASMTLTFRTVQINDILKSLVLLDENGTVQPAVYGARDPIGRTLQAFAVDVSQPVSRAALLNQLRGERVTVEAGGMPLPEGKTSPRMTITGRIVGVEPHQNEIAGGGSGGGGMGGFLPPGGEILTIFGDDGLQSVPLREVRSIRLLDERLNKEFQNALALLASGADDARRPVTLRFDGEGRRRVRVGYVTEAPLWKISYRLILGGSEERPLSGGGGTSPSPDSEKPYMQGWALVENTTDEDWNNVRLSLVSGRPVSFIQDLYQPLYLPRPVVPNDVIASPYPQLAAGNLEEERKEKQVTANTARRGGIGGGGFGGGGLAGPGGAPAPAAEGLADSAAAPTASAGVSFSEVMARASVAAQAAGEKAGELFRYNITTPVSLPRQQAAMIPVIAQQIDGEKVSVYNADTGPRFPMNAVRVVNNTTLHLKGGPVTIFDDGTYAGDGRMEDVPPGDSRLVTYAVDLSVEGERQGTGTNTTQTSLAIRRGVMIMTRRERHETTYTLRNKSDETRTVLVEHPFQAEYKLVLPEKAGERTADRYRFSVPVTPDKPETLKVVVERPVSQAVGLFDADINTLNAYVSRGEVSEPIKAALREVLQRRRRIQELQSEASTAEAEIAAIDRDQDRIRKNMAALDKESALYKRYVAELDKQETRIQSLRERAARLRASAAEAERDLRAYVDMLDVSA